VSLRRSSYAEPALAAIQVQGMTREAFLVRATLAAGAVYGLGAVTPFVRTALAQEEETGDLNILNFALLLEHLEAAFYEQARQEVKLDSDAQRLTEELAVNEGAHVVALTEAIEKLNGRPTAAPEVDFGNAFASQSSYLKLAQIFEDTGVSAYNGVAPDLESKDTLKLAGSIVQVEGRHAGLIRMIRGEDPAPRAFDDGLTIPQVRIRVQPYILG
jgi:rubrerythrin